MDIDATCDCTPTNHMHSNANPQNGASLALTESLGLCSASVHTFRQVRAAPQLISDADFTLSVRVSMNTTYIVELVKSLRRF